MIRIYTWTAIYLDNTKLEQFSEVGRERLFKEIDQDRLYELQLHGDYTDYLVNLVDGSFEINTTKFSFNGFDNSKFKLIYFKRVRQNLGGVVPIEITYNIGWQVAGDSKQANQQRIMQIHPDNSISFEVK